MSEEITSVEPTPETPAEGTPEPQVFNYVVADQAAAEFVPSSNPASPLAAG